LCIKANSTTFC